MSTSTTSRRRTIADGRALLTDWKASGLTARAFCHAGRISLTGSISESAA